MNSEAVHTLIPYDLSEIILELVPVKNYLPSHGLVFKP